MRVDWRGPAVPRKLGAFFHSSIVGLAFGWCSGWPCVGAMVAGAHSVAFIGRGSQSGDHKN